MINPNFIYVMIAVFVLIFVTFNSTNVSRLFGRLFQKKFGDYVTICPRCGSTKVSVDYSNPVVWSSGVPPKNTCLSCKHISYVFPEVEKKELHKYQKELKKDTSLGKINAQIELLYDITPGYNVGRIEFMFMIIFILLTIIIALLTK